MGSYDVRDVKAEYEEFYKHNDFRSYPGERKVVQSIIRQLDLEKGSKVLDVPCGTGKFAQYFADEQIDVVGVDISEIGIDIANGEFSQPGFLVGDATNLPVKNGTFDLVFCHGFSLFNTSDLKDVSPFIEGVLDVLTEDGAFVWGKTTNLSDTDVGSRFDHSLETLKDYFEGFGGFGAVEAYATVPHLCVLMRKYGLNKPTTSVLSAAAKTTGVPVRAYCIAQC